MHELSLCQMILEIVKKKAAEINCQQIKKIGLEIGTLVGVDHAALLFGLEIVTEGTLAEKVSVEITEIQGMAICDFCAKTVLLENYYDACQNCGHFSLKVFQGEELRVKYMEVE